MSTPASLHRQHWASLQQVIERFGDKENFFDLTPEAVDVKARLLLLDTVGCMLAARASPEVAGLESEFSSLESGPFRFPGGQRLSALGATAVGAMAATWDEACEGHALAHGRPGVPVIAALLPQAIARDLDLGALLGALIAGYEVGARAGAWLRIGPRMHVDGNWPALGVAAATARLLDLAPGLALTAVRTAACQLPASLYLPVAAGANARNTYLAHSAWLGLLAAFSAAGGVTAPDDAVPHYAEYFSAAGDEAPIDPERFLILEGYLKPHAAVRHAHYGAEAAGVLRKRLKGRTQDITAIRLSTYAEAENYCGNRDPQTPIQAQFSLSFGVAAGLRHGSIDAGVYRKNRFQDAELRRLEKLVSVTVDPALGSSGKRGATLAIEAGGKTRRARVTVIKGDAALPLSQEEVAAKFLRFTDRIIPTDKAYKFASALVSCEGKVRCRDIWELLF